jgi:hypothetical protein
MYFGLLRNNEAIQIQVEDVEYSGKYKTLNVNIPFSTKHRVNGFSFFIPEYLHRSFGLYFHQMVDKEGRFLKHYVKKYSGQTRDISYDYPRKHFLWTIKIRLNLEPGLLTTHFAPRSAAAALADAGILITNLK